MSTTSSSISLPQHTQRANGVTFSMCGALSLFHTYSLSLALALWLLLSCSLIFLFKCRVLDLVQKPGLAGRGEGCSVIFRLAETSLSGSLKIKSCYSWILKHVPTHSLQETHLPPAGPQSQLQTLHVASTCVSMRLEMSANNCSPCPVQRSIFLPGSSFTSLLSPFGPGGLCDFSEAFLSPAARV